MPELSVVVPAFRERENIPRLLDALEQALAGLDWETIVVVDDADDGSEALVRERAQHDPRVRCIQRIGRPGDEAEFRIREYGIAGLWRFIGRIRKCMHDGRR